MQAGAQAVIGLQKHRCMSKYSGTRPLSPVQFRVPATILLHPMGPSTALPLSLSAPSCSHYPRVEWPTNPAQLRESQLPLAISQHSLRSKSTLSLCLSDPS